MKRWEILFGLTIVIIGAITTINFDTALSWADKAFPSENFEKDGFIYKWSQSGNHDLSNIEFVHFNTTNGSIKILPPKEQNDESLKWNADIQITRGMFFGSDEKITSFKENVGVVMEEKNEHLYIKVQQPKSKPWGVKNVMVHLNASLPTDIKTSSETVNGEILVTEMKAPLQMKTINGKIKSVKCDAAIQANTVNGSIDIKNAGTSVQGESINGTMNVIFDTAPSEQCNFSTINGSVHLGFPKETALNLMLSTLNGRLECKGAQFEGKQERRSMDGTINGGGTLLKAETLNGSISIDMK